MINYGFLKIGMNNIQLQGIDLTIEQRDMGIMLNSYKDSFYDLSSFKEFFWSLPLY